MDSKSLGVVSIYILVVLIHFMMLLNLIAFASLPSAWVLIPLLEAVILFNQFAAQRKFNFRVEDTMDDFQWSRKCKEFTLLVMLWPAVFCEWKWGHGFQDLCHDLLKKFPIVVYIANGVAVFLYIIVFAFNLNNGFQIFWYVILMLLLIFQCFITIEVVVLIWIAFIILIPLLLMLLINLVIVPIALWCKDWFKNDERQRNAHNDNNQQAPER